MEQVYLEKYPRSNFRNVGACGPIDVTNYQQSSLVSDPSASALAREPGLENHHYYQFSFWDPDFLYTNVFQGFGKSMCPGPNWKTQVATEQLIKFYRPSLDYNLCEPLTHFSYRAQVYSRISSSFNEQNLVQQIARGTLSYLSQQTVMSISSQLILLANQANPKQYASCVAVIQESFYTHQPCFHE